jgi:hypothetical protein
MAALLPAGEQKAHVDSPHARVCSEPEDLQSLAVEVTALGARFDVMVQKLADMQEECRRRAPGLEVVSEQGNRCVVEMASLIKALDDSIMQAVSSNIEASIAELRGELCPWIEAVEEQLKGVTGGQAPLSSPGAGPQHVEVSETFQRQLGSIEAEVPLLAKAIVSGAQDVTLRLDEERTLRESTEAAMEARLARIETEVCSLASSRTHAPLDGSIKELPSKMPDAINGTSPLLLDGSSAKASPLIATTAALWTAPAPSRSPSRSSLKASARPHGSGNAKEAASFVPAAPPPTARDDDLLQTKEGVLHHQLSTRAEITLRPVSPGIRRLQSHTNAEAHRVLSTEFTPAALPPGAAYCKIIPRTGLSGSIRG